MGSMTCASVGGSSRSGWTGTRQGRKACRGVQPVQVGACDSLAKFRIPTEGTRCESCEPALWNAFWH